jgi:hypothetical protein
MYHGYDVSLDAHLAHLLGCQESTFFRFLVLSPALAFRGSHVFHMKCISSGVDRNRNCLHTPHLSLDNRSSSSWTTSLAFFASAKTWLTLLCEK